MHTHTSYLLLHDRAHSQPHKIYIFVRLFECRLFLSPLFNIAYNRTSAFDLGQHFFGELTEFFLFSVSVVVDFIDSCGFFSLSLFIGQASQKSTTSYISYERRTNKTEVTTTTKNEDRK